jgi:PQQ-dependent catabolism-associated CXXCW motif protein
MLPVRLAATAAGPGLAFFLKIRNWTDAWGPNRDASLARLVLELQTLTGVAPSWAPRVSSAPPETPAPAPPAPAFAPAPPPAPVPSPTPPAPAAPPPLALTSAPARPAAPNRTKLWLVLGLLVVIALAAALYFLTRRQPQTVPPWPNPPANNVVPNPPPTQPRAFANELTDYGVQAKSELEANVGTPTPLAIPIGTRVTTDEVQRMLAENRGIPIDVLESPHAVTLPGALYMPLGGQPGGFADAVQGQFAQQIAQATNGDTARPLIFFCQGASCWESYNAALRANAAGHGQIYWYRGGLAAWTEAGLPTMPLPAPFGGAAPGKE